MAPAGVLGWGKSPTAGAIASLAFDAAPDEIGIAIPSAAAKTTAIAAEGTSYKLSDISFDFVKYDLPRAFTDAMTAVLAFINIGFLHIHLLWDNLSIEINWNH